MGKSGAVNLRMPGRDGTIIQAEQVTLVKDRIRYNHAQVRERATELFQAPSRCSCPSMPKPTTPSSTTATRLRGESSICSRSPTTNGPLGTSARQPRPGGSRRCRRWAGTYTRAPPRFLLEGQRYHAGGFVHAADSAGSGAAASMVVPGRARRPCRAPVRTWRRPCAPSKAAPPEPEFSAGRAGSPSAGGRGRGASFPDRRERLIVTVMTTGTASPLTEGRLVHCPTAAVAASSSSGTDRITSTSTTSPV